MEEMEGRKRRDLTARVMNIEYGGIWSMYWAYYGVLLSFGSIYLLGLVLAAAGCLIFFLIVDKVAAGSKAA